MSGLRVVQISSDGRGNVDLNALRAECDDTLAGLMLTNPNTLGLFDENVKEVIRIVHEAGGLVYGDGANMNALLGIVRPGDLGIDVLHYNLHKTFSTPHGGGGLARSVAWPLTIDFLRPSSILKKAMMGPHPLYSFVTPAGVETQRFLGTLRHDGACLHLHPRPRPGWPARHLRVRCSQRQLPDETAARSLPPGL
jgi:glycine dehydrogenase subunit 2